MGKLFNLKKWLTVEDAARHLSIVFGEDVSAADVFRLALDHELTLSIHFVNGAHGRPGTLVPINEASYKEVQMISGSDTLRLYGGPKIRTNGIESHVLVLEKHVAMLTGVWDLPMIGGDRIEVEQIYQQLTGGPDATNVPMDGAFVEGADGQLCQLQDDLDDNKYFAGSAASLESLKRHIAAKKLNPADVEKLLNQHKDDRKKFLADRSSKPQTELFYPGGHLPEDGVLVVRIDALRELEKNVNGEPESTDKPLTTTERNNLLKLVIGMAIKGYSHGPAASKSTAPKEIADDLAALGMTITDDTVRKYLKQAADTVLPAKQRQP